MQQDLAGVLLRYAAALYGGDSASQLEAAKAQGWLDDEGKVTNDGRETAKALLDQQGTRSSFRLG